jgi:hypothetical protein
VRSGRLVLRQALSARQVGDLRSWIEEIESWAEAGGPGLHHFEQTPNGARLARSEDFDPHHGDLAAFIRDEVITGPLRSLLGEGAVLFKEKINFKHPGGGGFAPHQDASAYRFVDHHVSVLVPIDAADVDNGCLSFADGHTEGLLAHTGGRIDPEWVHAATWVPVEVEPGDLVFFDSYAPHRSDTNRSSSSRRAMYLTYNAASHGDLRSRYYQDKRALLDNLAEGAHSETQRARISINDDFLGQAVPRSNSTISSASS